MDSQGTRTPHEYLTSQAIHCTVPQSCTFLSTSRGHPVHMWDAFTGSVCCSPSPPLDFRDGNPSHTTQSRCTYRAYDHADELVSAISAVFNATGDKYGRTRLPSFFFF